MANKKIKGSLDIVQKHLNLELAEQFLIKEEKV